MSEDGAQASKIAARQPKPLSGRIWQSFMSSLGAIVFGMEDGTVSIFGLVFGVAASATSSQVVLLAGATGAISAAVSMMAGTYLDVSTERDRAQSAIDHEQRELDQEPEKEAEEVRSQLREQGFSPQDAETILAIFQRTPGAMLRNEITYELGLSSAGQQNPIVQSIWMFVADLFAAFVPVLPFAFLPLASARTVSLIVTTVLLLLLGIGRGVIGHKNVVVTAVQTLLIAAAAAAAGLLVGTLVGGQIG